MTVQSTSWSKFALTEKLEAKLGDPSNPDNPLSYAYSQKIDENDRFPEEALRWMSGLELARHFVPEEFGGSFRSLAELAEVIRVVARRDMTCAVGFSTRFWAFMTWTAGTEDQKRRLADYLMNRRGAISFPCSEKAHGADLVANDTVALPNAEGYEVTGEKWPIGNATFADVCFLLAATDPSSSKGRLSLFMLDKKDLDQNRVTPMPKVLMLGLRGGDISGLKFDHCQIPARSLLGREGAGLELTLKIFQVSRALCAAFSLGVADTALRTTLNFATRRKLYGDSVIDLPHAAQVLSDAFLDLITCECVLNSGLRALHVVPEQASAWSAVVKVFVPTVLEGMMKDISVVLGARFYMREEHDLGIFQKFLRDGSIVSVFDGNTAVNLHGLLLQFGHLARRPVAPGDHEARLEQIFALNDPLPAFDGRRLGMISSHANDALESVESSLDRLKTRGEESGLEARDIEQIASFGKKLLNLIAAHHDSFVDSEFEHGRRQSPAMFRAAKKYCALHAAASVLRTWISNPTGGSSFFARGRWLVPALARIFDKHLQVHEEELLDMHRSEVVEEMLRLHRENRMFSIGASRLATQ
jgi:alkylation response protein AidB-like acyl-CoA dehydrogenase